MAIATPAGRVLATCSRGERAALMSKPEVASVLLDVAEGVVGDVHAGPGERQVALIDEETRRALTERVRTLECGALGENLVLDVPAGLFERGAMLFFAGGALIEVTVPRRPCVELEQVASGLLRAAVGRCGHFATVRRGGVVAAGDLVTAMPAATLARTTQDEGGQS